MARSGHSAQRYSTALLLLLILSFFSCAGAPPVMEPAPEKEKTAPSAASEETTLPPKMKIAEPDYLSIVAAGDNLYHNVMIRDGEEGDYESIYQEIRSLAEPADIAFINQETLLAGEDFGFSSYPKFNTPYGVGRAIAAAGFNVINHATNHIMDKGEKAILSTMDFWDTIPRTTVLGIHRSEEERKLPVLIEKNNIRVGFLAYTYGTNAIPVPTDKSYLVSLINTEIMGEEIDALRPLCDFLVVSMHWGEEYSHARSKEQENLAAFLAEHKVDLVIGHHPHVLQFIEFIPRPDGKLMLCYYSLGNLISAQTQKPALLGALAYVRIKKPPAAEEGEEPVIVFEEAGAIPLVSHYEKNFTGFMIYPLYAYTEELLEKHWINQGKKELIMEYLKDLSAKYLRDKEMPGNPFSSQAVTVPDLYR